MFETTSVDVEQRAFTGGLPDGAGIDRLIEHAHERYAGHGAGTVADYTRSSRRPTPTGSASRSSR